MTIYCSLDNLLALFWRRRVGLLLGVRGLKRRQRDEVLVNAVDGWKLGHVDIEATGIVNLLVFGCVRMCVCESGAINTIGRAGGRGKGEDSGGAGSLKKKQNKHKNTG